MRASRTVIYFLISTAAPAIIERHSVLTYNLPSFAIASPKVANATEGAPANKPAKLAGLKRLPAMEKAETTTPPIKNRTAASAKNPIPRAGQMFCTRTAFFGS